LKKIEAIILAAGLGTRMKSETAKVLHKVHGRPILGFILDALTSAGIKDKTVIVSAKDNSIKKAFPEINTINQKKPLGSGDALKEARKSFNNSSGDIIVLCGDTPLISSDTIKKLIKKHTSENLSCTLLTVRVQNPKGYGRIVRDERGEVLKIVEEKDLSVYEEVIDEINVGAYCFNTKDLSCYIDQIKMNNIKKEFYLTDIVDILKNNGKSISTVICESEEESLGINSKKDLALANSIIKYRVLERFMSLGVTIIDPESTHIDMDTEIGEDTVVYPSTIIEKNVKIGKMCSIGPFARLRKGTVIKDNVEIGNFVEIVRSTISSGTKIKHLTYIGDAEIGKKVNIGAGVITANYDGKNKNKTFIDDEAFIGVRSVLIAPLKVGKGAMIGAGSVVTKNKHVPAGKTVVGVPAKVLQKKK
jgi:bifunctional UDP-N-acetylglucosamine pyrophosphorylase / glucosamine-1-phosphate N-acetyltransferase